GQLARVRAPLRARRRRPRAPLRRTPPAPRRLPDLVPAARARPRALVPHAARPHAARSVGGRAAVRARPVRRRGTALPSPRGLSLPFHGRGDTRTHRRVVDTRPGRRLPSHRRVVPVLPRGVTVAAPTTIVDGRFQAVVRARRTSARTAGGRAPCTSWFG